jgi:hypothetical protein
MLPQSRLADGVLILTRTTLLALDQAINCGPKRR